MFTQINNGINKWDKTLDITLKNEITNIKHLMVGAGVHLHHAIYSSAENATNKKLIKIIT